MFRQRFPAVVLEEDAMVIEDTQAVLDFTAVKGKIYYVWQEVKMGLFAARSMLHMVDEKVRTGGSA